MKSATPSEIALRAFRKHEEIHGLNHYTGILSLQGLAHLALHHGDPEVLKLARDRFLPFCHGKISYKCNFQNYLCGGNGAALLLSKGHLPEAEAGVREQAEKLMNEAPRDKEEIFCSPGTPEKERIWIDTAFAVTPFLLYAGLAFNDDRYLEEAYQQTAGMIRVLRNEENGLVHQAKNFGGPGVITADHWSRGNGWCMLALAELIEGLPEGDPRRAPAIELFIPFVQACIAAQDEAGLWHQEMTQHDSYTETSGSGLILYGIAVGLAKGTLPDAYRSNYLRGIQAYLKYIEPDGTVHQTCRGCLAPGDGSIAAYLEKPTIVNDPHAFGPVILAFGAAQRLGIQTIERPSSSSPGAGSHSLDSDSGPAGNKL